MGRSLREGESQNFEENGLAFVAVYFIVILIVILVSFLSC